MLALRSSLCAAESVFPPSLFEKRVFPVSHAGEARFVPYYAWQMLCVHTTLYSRKPHHNAGEANAVRARPAGAIPARYWAVDLKECD